MAELHKLLGVKPIFTTPYHPSGNERVERLHEALMAALRKLCADKPREWHRYLTPNLFALKELPSDRTGFSAFELLYGRSVRERLSVLRDLCKQRDLEADDRPRFQYVLELRDKLSECAKLAARNPDISVTRYKSCFDVRSQDRQFKLGDEVLVLLSSETSKLLISFAGPYKVLERLGKVDYLIDDPKGPKLYYANLLKRYHRRAHVNFAEVLDEVPTLEEESSTKVKPLTMELSADDASSQLPITPDGQIACSNRRPVIEPTFNWKQHADIEDLLLEFIDVFSDVPGCTAHDPASLSSPPTEYGQKCILFQFTSNHISRMRSTNCKNRASSYYLRRPNVRLS